LTSFQPGIVADGHVRQKDGVIDAIGLGCR
jgi:hypothetical protein